MRLGAAGSHRRLGGHSLNRRLVRPGSGLYRCGGPLILQLEEGFFKITARKKCNKSCSPRADEEAYEYERQWSVAPKCQPRQTYRKGRYETTGHFKYKGVDEVQAVTDLSEKLQDRTLYNPRPAACPQQKRRAQRSRKQHIEQRPAQRCTQKSGWRDGRKSAKPRPCDYQQERCRNAKNRKPFHGPPVCEKSPARDR